MDEEKRHKLQSLADTYELHPRTASLRFTYHEREQLIVLFERVADNYIEADLLDVASELGVEIDTLRDLNSADDFTCASRSIPQTSQLFGRERARR